MLKASIYQIRDEFVLVERITHNPLYPRFIIVDRKYISDAYCELGYIGYVTPIGGNSYRFSGA